MPKVEAEAEREAVAFAVEGQGVSRRFGRRWALAEVNLRVAAGTTYVLAGRNGSGKSTLLCVLATLLRPDQGSIKVGGLDVRTRRDEVRRRTALLSHHSYLYDPLTAFENLQILARFMGQSDNRAQILTSLEQVGLADRAHDAVATFSAGMRKRLALARVLHQRAPIVFLDEPYGALDPPGFRLVREVLASLKADGVTVVLATHQLQRGSELADEALILDAGRVRWTGTARELPAAGVSVGLDEASA